MVEGLPQVGELRNDPGHVVARPQLVVASPQHLVEPAVELVALAVLDLGRPAPGVRVIGPPDGMPDVGTINSAVVNQPYWEDSRPSLSWAWLNSDSRRSCRPRSH
jgi:hypothetical protein